MPFPRNRLSPVRPGALRVLAGDGVGFRSCPCPEHPAEPWRRHIGRGLDRAVRRLDDGQPDFSARHRQLGELFDRPGQWRHLQPAERVFRNSEPGHRLDHVDDRREAAGQRPGLSRQPERDRDHQDRRRSDRRRVCRFHAWHSRQRLQQGQSQFCRQWRFRGRLERRLDHGRAGRLRRPPRRHGRRIRASCRFRWARSPWVRASRRR